MVETVAVAMRLELLEAIFEGARRLYPRETILLLRGKKRKDVIFIEELVVPPLATYGDGFANIPLHMLPIDFSIVGTVHSHPSGNLEPSDVDFNHFFGRILMIVGFPFSNQKDVAVYNSRGEKLLLQITNC
ncbi:MAG: Mov34/MPN/PAD-1 family protein [Candidatus Bathyarchaeia archaeon]